MVGMDHFVAVRLIAQMRHGKVLWQGDPGLGKSLMVKRLCRALTLGDCSFARIQFAPDVMPADKTGASWPQTDRTLKIELLPDFQELLLADETNLATPETKLALLVTIAKSQVTLLCVRKRLVRASSAPAF